MYIYIYMLPQMVQYAILYIIIYLIGINRLWYIYIYIHTIVTIIIILMLSMNKNINKCHYWYTTYHRYSITWMRLVKNSKNVLTMNHIVKAMGYLIDFLGHHTTEWPQPVHWHHLWSHRTGSTFPARSPKASLTCKFCQNISFTILYYTILYWFYWANIMIPRHLKPLHYPIFDFRTNPSLGSVDKCGGHLFPSCFNMSAKYKNDWNIHT